MLESLLLPLVFVLPTDDQQPPAAALWADLFDGMTLVGWEQHGGQAIYRVADGCIVGTSVQNSPNSFLCTAKPYGDFVLEYEFRVDRELNSGVQIRSSLVGKRVTGYQVEIDMDDERKRFWTAGIYEEGRRGWLDDLADNDAAREAHRPGDWNHVKVEANGPHIRTWLNGVPAADLIDPLTLEGFIGLQVHGVGKREDPLEVRWKNLRIRDLGRRQWRPVLRGSVGAFQSAEKFGEGCVSLEFLLDGSALEFAWGDVLISVRSDVRHVAFKVGANSGELSIGEKMHQVRPAGEGWNRLTVTRLGQRLAVHLNGLRIADLATDPPADDGSAVRSSILGKDRLTSDIRLLELLVGE